MLYLYAIIVIEFVLSRRFSVKSLYKCLNLKKMVQASFSKCFLVLRTPIGKLPNERTAKAKLYGLTNSLNVDSVSRVMMEHYNARSL